MDSPRLPVAFLLVGWILAMASPMRAGQPPEIGANDFRLSIMGGIGSADFDANQPAVAYNSDLDEYLVVWWGDGGPNQGDDVFEIYGQWYRPSGSFGLFLQISDMGPDNDSQFGAEHPAVAYDTNHQQFLVVWRGSDDSPGEYHIHGQLLTASGLPVGGPFQISDVDDTSYPSLAYNELDDEFLVVWLEGGAVQGQRLDAATGARLGAITVGVTGGVIGNTALAFNPQAHEYLVVWSGLVDFGSGPEVEILGQRLVAATGAPAGADDFRISDMGADGDLEFQATNPAVAFNPVDNQYLVVWQGDDNIAPLVNNELEIFGQLLDVAGAAVGLNDFRISDVGGSRESLFDAFEPAVAYDPTQELFVVVWYADDNVGGQVDGELEILGQTLDRSGVAQGPNDFRLSDAGGIGDPARDANRPAVAAGGKTGKLLVVWAADDDTDGQLDNELEIFGQQIDVTWKVFCDGFEAGDTTAWSSTVGVPER